MQVSLYKALRPIRHPAVWIPAAVLAAFTLVCWSTDLDMAVTRLFFAGPDGSSLADRWPLMNAQPWRLLYDWGVVPAWILGCGGMAVWLLSFLWKRLELWRDPGLFLALVLIAGPGILVNVVLKPYFSRPRPHATEPYGGERTFVPVGQRGSGTEDSSFPSGHAAMGFYLMSPAFICWRRRPGTASAIVAFGLCAGIVIGMARIVAGCHFPSDIIWTGGIIYYTALALAAPFRFDQKCPCSQPMNPPTG